MYYTLAYPKQCVYYKTNPGTSACMPLHCTYTVYVHKVCIYTHSTGSCQTVGKLHKYSRNQSHNGRSLQASSLLLQLMALTYQGARWLPPPPTHTHTQCT